MNTVVDPKNFETKLPPAVIRNAQAADEMQQQFINPVDPNAPPADPPVDPNAPPADSPIDPNAPPTAAQPPAEPDEGTWKHKYQSMQGRYNADVGRLKGQIDALTGQVTNLNKVLSTVAAPPADPGFSRTPAQVKTLITDEERAEYGDEFVDFAGRLATQEATRVAQPLLQQIEDLKRQVGGVGQSLQQNARAQLFENLDDEIPNWREVNTSEEFLEWLNLTDAYTGAIRQEILNNAFEQNNFPRVAAFFKGFLAELAATVAPRPGEPENKGIPVPKIALETIVAPGRAKSAAATPPPAPSEKPIIKPSDVAKFFNDKISGRYKGREAEANAMEASIILAGNEGRIRP
jgi:polyhydroxyalkanoate synthesis regulator phasin